MTEREWADFTLWLHGAFQQPLDEAAVAAYAHELGGLALDEAMAAVRLAAARSGRPDFRPSAVACALAAASGAEMAEDFDTAWSLFVEGWRASGRRLDDVAARVIADGLVVRGCPGMARMLLVRGLRALVSERTEDPEIGGAVRARLRAEHEAHVHAVREHGWRALARRGPGQLRPAADAVAQIERG